MEQLNKIYTMSKADQALMHYLKLSMHTMMIVRVVAVNATAQTVDVVPSIMAVVRDVNGTKKTISSLGEEIRVSDVELPAIKNVPISFPRAGNFSITLPITVGDEGMLIVSERDLSLWKNQGAPAPQGQASMFNFNDGVYLPGVPNSTTKISNYSTSNLELRAGSDKISMDGAGNINITGKLTVSGHVVSGTKDLTTHVHSVSGVSPGGSTVVSAPPT